MTTPKLQKCVCFIASAAFVLLAGCEKDVSPSVGDTPTPVLNATSDTTSDTTSDAPSSTADRTTQGSSQAKSGARNTQLAGPQNTRIVSPGESKNQNELPFPQPNSANTLGHKSYPSTPGSTAQQKAADRRETDGHEFEPPFGERTNLFLPIERRVTSSRNKARSVGPTIQLKGFARVDSLCAILALDGRILTLSEGEEKEGIRAIRVQPPHVQLQKDGRRWTLTLSKSLGSS